MYLRTVWGALHSGWCGEFRFSWQAAAPRPRFRVRNDHWHCRAEGVLHQYTHTHTHTHSKVCSHRWRQLRAPRRSFKISLPSTLISSLTHIHAHTDTGTPAAPRVAIGRVRKVLLLFFCLLLRISRSPSFWHYIFLCSADASYSWFHSEWPRCFQGNSQSTSVIKNTLLSIWTAIVINSFGNWKCPTYKLRTTNRMCSASLHYRELLSVSYNIIARLSAAINNYLSMCVYIFLIEIHVHQLEM